MIESLFRLYEEASALARRHAHWVTTLSILLFAVTIALAVYYSPVDLRALAPGPLAVIFLLLVPCTLLINALRIHVSSMALGTARGLGSSVRAALLSSAANLLPLPGGAVVRVSHIAAGDAGKLVSAGTVTVASVALSLAIGLAGLSASIGFRPGAGRFGAIGLFGAGCLAAATLFWLLRRIRPLHACQLAAVELAAMATESARVWTCLAALHSTVSPQNAIALSLNTVIGSLFGLAPGGLGIRELVGAGIAATLQVSAATVIIAIALNRLLGMSFMGLALFVGALKPTRNGR